MQITNITNPSTLNTSVRKTSIRSAHLQISSAILFGIVMLYGVGFASNDISHNAAHDTRHSFAFPCH